MSATWTRALLSATVAVAWLAPGTVGGDDTNTEPSGTYYLALGDSIAAGWQPIGDPDHDHRTRMGYVDQLWLLARPSYPDLHLVNLACPGASTQSMVAGDPRCPYPHGSQLAEALAFIEQHRDELAFITIDIGFADFACTDDVACLSDGLESIASGLPSILDALTQAAPGVQIVGMNVYNPFLSAWLEGDEASVDLSSMAVALLNSNLEGHYRAAGIPVADVAAAFAIGDSDADLRMVDHGSVPRNVGLLCAWTWQCHDQPFGPDRHPNVLGARSIAEAFAAELGIPTTSLLVVPEWTDSEPAPSGDGGE